MPIMVMPPTQKIIQLVFGFAFRVALPVTINASPTMKMLMLVVFINYWHVVD